MAKYVTYCNPGKAFSACVADVWGAPKEFVDGLLSKHYPEGVTRSLEERYWAAKHLIDDLIAAGYSKRHRQCFMCEPPRDG